MKLNFHRREGNSVNDFQLWHFIFEKNIWKQNNWKHTKIFLKCSKMCMSNSNRSKTTPRRSCLWCSCTYQTDDKRQFLCPRWVRNKRPRPFFVEIALTIVIYVCCRRAQMNSPAHKWWGGWISNRHRSLWKNGESVAPNKGAAQKPTHSAFELRSTRH